MAMIRECQPTSFEEWEKWYFENAVTETVTPVKITRDTLIELGERLYSKITEIVIPEWTAAFDELTLNDCIDYITNLTLNRTYDGYLREKSVIFDNLSPIFKDIKFEESDPELDHAGDIDYLGWVNDMAFGIQIKPVTAKANFGNYSASERMKNSFLDFENKYGGRVFIVFSLDKKVANTEVLSEIEMEIKRLQSLSHK